MEREADFGGFLQETFALIGDSWAVLLAYVAGLAVITTVPFALLDITFPVGGGINIIQAFDSLEGGLVLAVVGIGITLAMFAAQYYVIAYLLNQRGYRNAGNGILLYVLFSIVYLLGLALGFLFLVIPGIILSVRWIASGGFFISEGDGIRDSLGKSWELTDGYGWPIFFGLVVIGLAASVVAGVASLPFANAVEDGALWAIGISNFLENLSTVISLPFGVAVFYLLHDGSAQIGEVFE